MVKVTTTVELNTLSEIGELGVVSLLEGRSSLFLEGIQVVHVGLMMLSVVEFHQLLGDHWLQAVDWVWKGLQDSSLEGSEGSVLHWSYHHGRSSQERVHQHLF